MKKLKDYVQEQRREDEKPLQNGEKSVEKQSGKSMKNYMPITADRQTAIDEKIKTVQGSIFGKPVNKIDIGTVRDVWVPYGYFVYDYEVGGKGLFKAKRSGQIHIIYDMNERHCIQYDEKESGALPLKKKDLSEEKRTFLKAAAHNRSEILLDVEDYVQMKVMYKTFGHRGDIRLVKQVDFYRPAVELEVFFKGRNRNIRFAYLDEYAVKSEHILGMKYRITH